MVASGMAAHAVSGPQSTIGHGGTRKFQTIDEGIAELQENSVNRVTLSFTYGSTTLTNE